MNLLEEEDGAERSTVSIIDAIYMSSKVRTQEKLNMTKPKSLIDQYLAY